MIIKVCQFQARRDQGERLVQIFQPGEMEKAAEFFAMGKQAAPMLPKVQQYLEDLKPNPNKIYVLVNALGAGEFWGSNINGDWFPEAALVHKGMDFGHETFYNAYPYKHHVNKDPSRAFGKVELVCWHDDMKRVELVVAIDRELAKRFAAEDVCDKLDAGQFPDVSMGCKVPYDLCSICTDWKKYRRAQSTYNPSLHQTVGKAVLAFHKKDPIRGVSVTRNDYCEHLKTQLNRILSDGRKVYAINDFPRFFDISFVFIGADKTAKVMAKLAMAYAGGSKYVAVPSWFVAEQLGYQPETEKAFEKVAGKWLDRFAKAEDVARDIRTAVTPKTTASVLHKVKPKEKVAGIAAVRAQLREKMASHRKGAEIIKEVVPTQFGGKAVPIEGSRPDLPDSILDLLGKSGLSEALSTPTSMGMLLKPREFQRITIIRLGKKPLADDLDRAGEVFPPSDESDTDIPMGLGHFSSALKRALMPQMEDRSCLEPVIQRRVVRITITPKPEEADESLKIAAATPLLTKIAAAYNGYLDRIGECLVGVDETMAKHPDLWEAVHRSGLADSFNKVAAGIDPKVLIGAVGGAALVSQIARYRRRQAMMGGRQTGFITDTLADNPKTLMLLAGMGALHQQGSDLPGKLMRGVGNAARNVVGGLTR